MKVSGIHPTATNRTRDVMSLGAIDGAIFSVFCSHLTLVILDGEMRTVQKLVEDGPSDGLGFVAVDTCTADAKIAAVADGVTRIYRPRKRAAAEASTVTSPVGAYTWHKTATLLSMGDPPRCLTWNPRGDRLVVGGQYFTVWGHQAVVASADSPRFYELLENRDANLDYVPQTNRQLPAPAKQVGFSPDGRLIASIAENDRLLKVWFTLPHEISRYQFDESPSFLYLEHPAAVGDFSWRRLPDFTIHSTFVVNVLVTSCRDNLCRVWSESAASEPLGLFLTAIIDPSSFPGFEPVASGFRLHWLDCRSLRGDLAAQVAGLSTGGASGANCVTLQDTVPEPPASASEATETRSRSGTRGEATAAPARSSRVLDTSDFVVIADDGGFRSSIMTPAPFSFSESSLASPHVPSKVTRACLTMAVPPAEETEVLDILYFVHPNGSLVFWSISYLDTVPRRSPYIKLISGTDTGVIPVGDGASVIGNVEAYLDRGHCLWRRRVNDFPADGHGDFSYYVPRSTSLSLVMHHGTGDVTQWVATFADRGSFGEVLEVRETARISGPSSAVIGMVPHPLLPEVATVCGFQGATEIVVWHTRSPLDEGIQRTGVLERIARCIHADRPDAGAVLAWVPSVSRQALVVASPGGLHVYVVDAASSSLRLGAKAEVQFGHVASCFVQHGAPAADGRNTATFHAMVLCEDGSIDLWQLDLPSEGTVTLAKVVVDPKEANALTGPYVFAFAIPGGHLADLGLFADDDCDPPPLLLGVVSKSGSIAALQCTLAFDADGKALCKSRTLLESDAAVVPKGRLRVMECSLHGHLAMAVEAESSHGDRPQYDVSVWNWRLTGKGPVLEASVYSGPTCTCDLAWGTSQLQKETLYVMTDDDLFAFSPCTVVDLSLAARDTFSMVSRTTRTVPQDIDQNQGLPPILRSTVCGQVLVSEWNEIHGYGHCTITESEEEDGAGTLEQLIFRRGRILPQLHDVLLADLLFAGRSDRIESILGHMAKGHRSARPSPRLNPGSREQNPAARKVQPLGLDKLYPDEGDDSAVEAAAASGEEKYTDLFALGDGNTKDDNDAVNFVRNMLTNESIDGLSRREQVAALSLIEAYSVLDEDKGSLDEPGVRFFVPALHKSFLAKQRGGDSFELEPSHYAWALHSEAQEFILEKCPGLGAKGADMTWEDLRAHGAGYWINSLETLKKYIEIIARNQFTKTKEPLDCAIWYLAMRKKKILWGLFKSVHDQRLASFFGYDFNDDMNKTKALKNAYALMGKRRHHVAVGFFLLGGSLSDAVSVCLRNLKDVQLALVITRLYEDDRAGDSPALKALLTEQYNEAENPFAKTIFAWLKKDSEAAVDALLRVADPKSANIAAGGASEAADTASYRGVDAPAALNLCRFLQNHPHVKKLKDSAVIQRVPTALYFQAYASYMRRGMPQLALDTLLAFASTFREDMAENGGGPNAEAGKADATAAPAPETKTYSSAIDTGQLDFFGGFGGFDDEFAQFNLPAAAAAGPDDAAASAADVGGVGVCDGDAADPSFLLRLVTVWQAEACLKLIANGFAAAPLVSSWPTFAESVDKQAATMARLCGCSVTPRLREMILQRCEEVAIGLENKRLRCLIVACRDAASVSEFIGSMCDSLTLRIEQFVDMTHSALKKPSTAVDSDRAELAHQIDRETSELADCLQQILANGQDIPTLTAEQIGECVVIIYTALWIICWLQRNIASLHALLTNKPTADVFGIAAGGMDTPNLVERFLQPIDVAQYADLDVGADQDEDGNAVVTVYPHDSPEAKVERFLWATLDVAAMQQFVNCVREVIALAGLAQSVSMSRRVDVVSEAMEECLAALEITLVSLSPPPNVMAVGSSVGVEHSVHGLFKIRSLMEPRNNKFQTYESRRLWAYLVSSERMHRLVEHHIFDRARNSHESVGDTPESALVYSSARSEGEIYAVRVNPRRPTQLVIGTAKGLVELSSDGAAAASAGFSGVYSGGATALFSPLSSGMSTPAVPSPLNRSRPRTPDGDGGFGDRRDSTGSEGSPELAGLAGAAVETRFVATMHRPTNGAVRAIAQHPVMPCYVSGTSYGELDLWHFDQQHQLSKFEFYSQSKTKVTSVHFSDLGNKFGATMSSGDLALWRFLTQDESDAPFLTFKAHSRRTNDFLFAGATSLVVTGGIGSGSDGGNVALWDTLLMSTDRSCHTYPVRVFNVNESGTISLAYSKATQRLFCGGNKGEIAVVDFRKQKVVRAWMGHEGAVNKMAIDEAHGTLVTASGTGAVKLWALNNLRQIANFEGVHARSSFSVSGVVGMDLHGDSLYTTGLDGAVKVTHPWTVFGGGSL